jgi:hypothetical protein
MLIHFCDFYYQSVSYQLMIWHVVKSFIQYMLFYVSIIICDRIYTLILKQKPGQRIMSLSSVIYLSGIAQETVLPYLIHNVMLLVKIFAIQIYLFFIFISVHTWKYKYLFEHQIKLRQSTHFSCSFYCKLAAMLSLFRIPSAGGWIPWPTFNLTGSLSLCINSYIISDCWMQTLCKTSYNNVHNCLYPIHNQACKAWKSTL